MKSCDCCFNKNEFILDKVCSSVYLLILFIVVVGLANT